MLSTRLSSTVTQCVVGGGVMVVMMSDDGNEYDGNEYDDDAAEYLLWTCSTI